MKISKVLIVLISVISIISCSKKDDPTPAKRQAEVKITDSFKTESISSGLGQNQGKITINKEALGKAFLLTPTVVIANSNPIVDHLQPLVVIFEKNGDQIALFEINVLSFYEALPTNKLIQTFKVVSETEKDVTFDWNYGIEFIQIKSYNYASDFPQENTDTTVAPEPVTPAATSFVRNIKVDKNSLEIEQASRLRTQNLSISMVSVLTGQPMDLGVNDVSVNLYFKITPYVANANFKIKESELKKGIGFFEQISYDKSDARKVVQSMRWDLSKGPIVYALTKDTPAEYLDAVKEGILYWNKVLGQEVIKVETGADPREFPEPRRVLVHWINWDEASFARASLQADPLTGELYSGNVYMTSVFTTGAQKSARMETPLSKSKKVYSIRPSGFQSGFACDYNHAQQFLTSEASQTENPAIMLKAAQDFVRATVAHEVGHTLGLRHNFAGSMESEITSFAKLNEITQAYLNDIHHPGAIGASTVMDYDGGMVSSFVGAAILKTALPYDVKALQWGYTALDMKAADLKAPLFCTDGDLKEDSSLVGCEQFDIGTNPVEVRIEQAKKLRDTMAYRAVRGWAGKLYPAKKSTAMSIDDLTNALNQSDLTKRADVFTSDAKSIMAALVDSATYVSVEKTLGPAGWINSDLYDEKTFAAIEPLSKSINGLPGALQAYLVLNDDFALQKGWLTKQAETFVTSKNFASGITLEGIPYQFTNEEQEAIHNLLSTYAENFEDVYVATILSKFTLDTKQATTMNPQLVNKEWEEKIGKFVSHMLLDSDKELTLKIVDREIKVPAPSFSKALQLKALPLLANKAFAKKKWNQAIKENLTKVLVERLRLISNDKSEDSAALKVAIKKLDLEGTAAAWAQTELAILKAIEDLDGD